MFTQIIQLIVHISRNIAPQNFTTLMKRHIFILIVCLAAVACKQHTAEQSQPTTTAKPVVKDTTHLVGLWLDESIKTEKGEQIAYEIVSQGNKNFIQVITFTGKKLDVEDSPVISPSATALRKDGDKYVNTQNPNEVFVIYKGGDLLIHDETGMVARCKRML